MKRIFFLLLLWLTGAGALADQPSAVLAPDGDVEQWLLRLHDATRQRAYVGTFVVTAGSTMSTSRIWHVCNGREQIERVDALTGVRRSTFRRDDSVVTFWPDSRTVVQETRESMGLFPTLLQHPAADIGRFYQLQRLGHGRVAGIESDVVQLAPLDSWRFGYRVWTERQSGLVVKLQTLDAAAQVLEQAAFSELQFNTPLTFHRLKVLMQSTQGYQVHSPKLLKTAPEQEGWTVNAAVPGFVPVRCYRSVDRSEAADDRALQCIFSDGLASVSVFIEPFDASRHVRGDAHEQLLMGATHLRVRRAQDWWLTAVGEAPGTTLTGLLQALERKK
ncbi:MAG: MucB/RseB C-terminal domain-containing protein [Rhodoferax sp.]|nr:MucB/RseB C-terminal domain-containing protein [Rhodoferax sp.]